MITFRLTRSWWDVFWRSLTFSYVQWKQTLNFSHPLKSDICSCLTRTIGTCHFWSKWKIWHRPVWIIGQLFPLTTALLSYIFTRLLPLTIVAYIDIFIYWTVFSSNMLLIHHQVSAIKGSISYVWCNVEHGRKSYCVYLLWISTGLIVIINEVFI